MQKTNIRDRISWRKYYLARLTKQCLLVYACLAICIRAQWSAVQWYVAQLDSKCMSCRRSRRSYLQPYQQPSQNRDIDSYQFTQFVRVKLRQLQIRLASCYLQQARQLASSPVVPVVISYQSFTSHYVGSLITQLGYFQVVQLGRSLNTEQRRCMQGVCSQLLAIY